MDVVDGYTAISKLAIDVIDWKRRERIRISMDFLIRINAYGLKSWTFQEQPFISGERQYNKRF